MMRIFDTSSWFRPAGQILAADGDQFVGLSAVGYFEQSNSCYNLMTGVLASHRGRKIAQALKLRSIQFAKAIGAAYIRTNNDSENAAMLAINRKLGYVPKPGIYRLYNRLKP
jgi:predicted GNAT superfamily acetyltransferase